MKARLIIGLCSMLGLGPAARSATTSYSDTAPAVGPHDRANLAGASRKALNVTGGTDQDDALYIANDRPVQGQTFTTGANSMGYQLTAVTLKHVGYRTFTSLGQINYTIRVIRPSGATFTVVALETALTPPPADPNAEFFITFTFDNPVTLNANTTYGFDVGGGPGSYYWELDGLGSGPYAGGVAYSTGGSGTGDTGFIARTGDRVFVATMVAGGVPIVSTPTITPTNYVYAGTPVTLNVRATGATPLYYQWREGGFPISGANDTNLNIDTTVLIGPLEYDVVVSNAVATVISAPVTLTVADATVPILLMDTTPASATRVVGQSVTFTAAFDGTRPITYIWQKDFEDIPGATNTRLTLTDLQISDSGEYSLIASNIHGTTPSTLALLNVLEGPEPPAPGTFAHAVLTNEPIHYWRLNETNGAAEILDWGTQTINALNDGATLGVPGLRSPAYPAFSPDNTAASFDGSRAAVRTGASLMNTLPRFTILAWLYPIGVNGGITGLIGQNDGLECIYSDENGITVWVQLNGAWEPFSTGPAPFQTNRWHFIAIVADGTKAHTYVNGLRVASNPGSGGPSTGASGSPFNIGGPEIIGYPGENALSGLLEDVAMYDRALSQEQIQDLYALALGGAPPSILNQPKSQSLYAGRTARFTASGIGGSSPLTYRWQKEISGVFNNISDGANISGATSNSLTIGNVATPNEGNYRLVITNAAGAITSSVVSLVVLQPTGTPYETAALGLNPRAYWRLNETANPAAGGVLAHDYWGGFAGTYGSNALNGFNAISGPLPADGFNAFETSNTALQPAMGLEDSWVTIPGLGLQTNRMSFTMWIKPNGSQADYAALFMNRSGVDSAAGVSYGGSYISNNVGQLIYTWNRNDILTWGFPSGLYIQDGVWSFVALVIEPSRATLYLYNASGQLSATNEIIHLNESLSTPSRIGSDAGFVADRNFNGIIDEVAIFDYALTPAQVLSLYHGNASGEVRLTLERPEPNLRLLWPQGTLQEALSPIGPWTNTPYVSPYDFAPLGSQKYYRVLVSP